MLRSFTDSSMRISCNPSHDLRGEAVEGGEGLFEVVFAGVFDFVVADAVEALDEHHDGGDAGHGDFGGIV